MWLDSKEWLQVDSIVSWWGHTSGPQPKCGSSMSIETILSVRSRVYIYYYCHNWNITTEKFNNGVIKQWRWLFYLSGLPTHGHNCIPHLHCMGAEISVSINKQNTLMDTTTINGVFVQQSSGNLSETFDLLKFVNTLTPLSSSKWWASSVDHLKQGWVILEEWTRGGG